LKIIGDLETINESLERRRGDANYFKDNYADLSERFPDEWVAVFNQEVVGHDRDPVDLIRFMRYKGVNDFYMERIYVNEKPPILILSAA
tara:strand:+ start:1027 stop:1293 length:267 start_codon:yes stop_codon:yes gene_type:complete